MPTSVGGDEIVTQLHNRLFFQLGGPYPSNPLLYYGKNWQYAFISGGTLPYGDVSPINVPSPDQIKKYRAVGESVDAPDFPTMQLQLLEKHGYVPRDLGRQGCRHNAYVVVGNCNDLSDPLNGWTDFVQTYARFKATQVDFGDTMSMDSDDAVSDTYDMTGLDIYRSGKVNFGTLATTQIDREVLDSVWGGGSQCGGCGPADNGAQRLYSLTRASGAGSPGLPAEVIYTLFNSDGSQTVVEYTITGLPALTTPTAIDIMGSYLVVLVASEAAYYYATINALTGAVGTWTKVTTGFVAGALPNDIFVISSTLAWICGNGGYIYRINSVPSGVTVVNAGATTTQNLTRIHGDGNLRIVAGGGSAAIITSADAGVTWATTPATTGGVISGIAVKDHFHWWVTTVAGLRAYTLNAGNSWVPQLIAGVTAINDIVFANDEVGYVAYENASGAALQATQFGGAEWADSGAANSRLGTLPAHVRTNRIALPRTTVDITTAILALAGLATGSTDGSLILGNTAVL